MSQEVESSVCSESESWPEPQLVYIIYWFTTEGAREPIWDVSSEPEIPSLSKSFLFLGFKSHLFINYDYKRSCLVAACLHFDPNCRLHGLSWINFNLVPEHPAFNRSHCQSLLDLVILRSQKFMQNQVISVIFKGSLRVFLMICAFSRILVCGTWV